MAQKAVYLASYQGWYFGKLQVMHVLTHQVGALWLDGEIKYMRSLSVVLLTGSASLCNLGWAPTN